MQSAFRLVAATGVLVLSLLVGACGPLNPPPADSEDVLADNSRFAASADTPDAPVLPPFFAPDPDSDGVPGTPLPPRHDGDDLAPHDPKDEDEPQATARTSAPDDLWVILQARLYRDDPVIFSPTISDWERVNRLRRWAYSNTTWAYSYPALLEVREAARYYQLGADELFSAFQRQAGGVYCAGASWAGMQLFQMFGYPTILLDLGDPVTQVSHVTAVVEIEHAGRLISVVQDVTFNLTYVDEWGLPLDYFAALARLRAGQTFRVRPSIAGDSPPPATLIPLAELEHASPEQLAAAAWTMVPGAVRFERLSNGEYVFWSHRNLARFEADLGDAYFDFLASRGQPRDLRYLLLFPFALYGTDAETALAFMQRVNRTAVTPARWEPLDQLNDADMGDAQAAEVGSVDNGAAPGE
ncbi:MAG: hypothetical protein AB7Q17_09425 [Phycisphaerae bacterium]